MCILAFDFNDTPLILKERSKIIAEEAFIFLLSSFKENNVKIVLLWFAYFIGLKKF